MEMQKTLVQNPAPAFKTTAVINGDFKTVSLADYKGKWVCLFFYPLDFTFVCPTEITAFSDRSKDFNANNCQVLGCSVDSQFTHLAWINTPRKDGGLGGLEYPLLADVSKDIARAYNVLTPGGVSLRGLFLINPEGQLVYQVVHDLGVGRSVDETLRVLQAFQHHAKTGEVCPANWVKGGKTMKPDPKGSQEYFNQL